MNIECCIDKVTNYIILFLVLPCCVVGILSAMIGLFICLGHLL